MIYIAFSGMYFCYRFTFYHIQIYLIIESSECRYPLREGRSFQPIWQGRGNIPICAPLIPRAFFLVTCLPIYGRMLCYNFHNQLKNSSQNCSHRDRNFENYLVWCSLAGCETRQEATAVKLIPILQTNLFF